MTYPPPAPYGAPPPGFGPPPFAGPRPPSTAMAYVCGIFFVIAGAVTFEVRTGIPSAPRIVQLALVLLGAVVAVLLFCRLSVGIWIGLVVALLGLGIIGWGVVADLMERHRIIGTLWFGPGALVVWALALVLVLLPPTRRAMRGYRPPMPGPYGPPPAGFAPPQPYPNQPPPFPQP